MNVREQLGILIGKLLFPLPDHHKHRVLSHQTMSQIAQATAMPKGMSSKCIPPQGAASWAGKRRRCRKTGTICLHCSCFPLLPFSPEWRHTAPPAPERSTSTDLPNTPHLSICTNGENHRIAYKGIFIQDDRGTSPCIMCNYWCHSSYVPSKHLNVFSKPQPPLPQHTDTEQEQER